MFRVIPPPIIRSAYNCIYSHLVFVTPLLLTAAVVKEWRVAVMVLQISDDVDIVVYAPDDGWRYHPKHVERFPDKIDCVTLHYFGYILECSIAIYQSQILCTLSS